MDASVRCSPHSRLASTAVRPLFGRSSARARGRTSLRLVSFCASKDCRASAHLDRAKQFYEAAWAGQLDLMPGLMAEAHVQRDMVWQAEPRVGRDRMAQGIENIRALYPDIAFRVTDACSSGDKVFVHWSMTGTFEGERAETSGVSMMSFDQEGRIAETRVYRQALPAEVKLAQRRANPVP